MHLKIEGLTKSFDGKEVLRGVDLEVPAGQLCVIVGASGTGKSVLLKHLVGLLKPDAGRILVDDKDIVPLSENQLMEVRRRFGMIFQSAGLLQSLTLGQNVGLVLEEIHGRPAEEVRRVVAEKLAMVGLEGREDQSPSTLSGGQRKRAAIARALTTDMDCLLYDEPTAGLDPIIASTVDEVIRDVNRRTGATTIVVTHDLASIFAVAEMVHMLHEGRCIFSGTPEEMRASTNERVREFLAREIALAGK
ncbi:MAG: ATP-binding cassette domain-containing protein [Candidatus Sumerlaeia bacterium]|nr:ATP-binding cassette domain-containing protein [Candidatus Sumerlaeia bacterium]